MLTRSRSNPEAARKSGKRGRRSAVGSGTLVLVVGVLTTLLLYTGIAYLQSLGESAAARAMPEMGMRNTAVYWSFPVLQATGVTGLLFAYASVLRGLLQSGRAPAQFPLDRRQIDRLHRQLALLVIGLVGVHVVATALDAMGDSWKTVLIPGQWAQLGWPQAVWGYNLGIFAMYILALTAPTFYLRRIISPGRWRFLHRFVLFFYVLSLWHALILGLDVGYYSWMRPATWLAQLPLLALFIRRL